MSDTDRAISKLRLAAGAPPAVDARIGVSQHDLIMLLDRLDERDAEIDRLRADRSLLLNVMRRVVTAIAAAAELDADFDLDSHALDKLLARFADDAARGKE